MKNKLILGMLGLGMVLVTMPLFAAFEAHVVNVTATIENALFVHPEAIEYNTVFPQEHLDSSFFITFSQSFSTRDQDRVGKVDYVIKQKPKCGLPILGTNPVQYSAYAQVTEDASGNFVCPEHYVQLPLLCPYLSKHPDNNPSTGPNANNDIGVPPFHDPNDPSSLAKGKLVKLPSIGSDPSDTWTIDLAVPCFSGQCAQDWPAFVHSLNPNADPNLYMANPADEHKVFGCDLWVEVTKIY